jgi:hypothetical protein
LHSDYETDRGFNPSSGIRIPGSLITPGSYPNVHDLACPGLSAWNTLFPTCCTATLELQYPAEETLRALTPPCNNTLGLQLEDNLEGPALSPLHTLAHIASIIRPTSAPPTPYNEDIHIFAPASPTPLLQYPDPLTVAQPQEKEAPTEFTFGPLSRSASPSYHVRSPMP